MSGYEYIDYLAQEADESEQLENERHAPTYRDLVLRGAFAGGAGLGTQSSGSKSHARVSASDSRREAPRTRPSESVSLNPPPPG